MAILGVGAWLAWFLGAGVTVVEPSAWARLEVGAAPHSAAVLDGGRVVASHLVLGGAVARGDALVELESGVQRALKDEADLRLAAAVAGAERARARAEAAGRAVVEEERTLEGALGEARAALDSARATSAYSQVQVERLSTLHASGLVADLEYRGIEAERSRADSATQASAQVLARLGHERRAALEAARAEHQEALTDAARAEGEVAAARAAVLRAAEDLERRTVRAPVAGRLGSVSPIRPGSALDPGEVVAQVVPEGALRVVAAFPAARAVGRVLPSRAARVRLDGFPSLVYGSLPARVSGVGTEAEGGLVRVELEVLPSTVPPSLPVQHGLTGVVEVDVERVTPATLVLRLAGRAVQGSGPPPMPGVAPDPP